jgi:hypothetical protein
LTTVAVPENVKVSPFSMKVSPERAGDLLLVAVSLLLE